MSLKKRLAYTAIGRSAPFFSPTTDRHEKRTGNGSGAGSSQKGQRFAIHATLSSPPPPNVQIAQTASEGETGSSLAADPERAEAPAIPLVEGSRQWRFTGIQGRKAKEIPRWGLSYTFGTFPLKAGNRINFPGQQYRLEEVGADSLRVSAL